MLKSKLNRATNESNSRRSQFKSSGGIHLSVLWTIQFPKNSWPFAIWSESVFMAIISQLPGIIYMGQYAFRYSSLIWGESTQKSSLFCIDFLCEWSGLGWQGIKFISYRSLVSRNFFRLSCLLKIWFYYLRKKWQSHDSRKHISCAHARGIHSKRNTPKIEPNCLSIHWIGSSSVILIGALNLLCARAWAQASSSTYFSKWQAE